MDPKIAQSIVDYLTLSDADRAELKSKRGFTDDMIDKLKFRSIGPHLKDDAHLELFPKEITESLCVKDNILIPYFNRDGTVYSIRPHKYGIKENGISPYIPWPIIKNTKGTWVITEGEFKAAAAVEYGYPCIGVPGIQSFVRNNFRDLQDMIIAIEPTGVVICFDHEIKDNPQFKNYKASFTKRYDSQFYAYVQAYMLEKELGKFQVGIATLPIELAVDGKVDIDGMLASGVSKEVFDKTIKTAQITKDYRKDWYNLPKAHQSFLQRKLDRFFYPGPISEDFDCYIYTNPKEKKEKDGEEIESKKNSKTKISNFVIKVINTLHGNAGVERQIYLKSPYGNSAPCVITPGIMCSQNSFLDFIYTQGDFSFNAPENAFKEMWKWVFLGQDGTFITKLEAYGYSPLHNLWAFGNGIYKNEQFYPADESGIVIIGEDGFKLLDIGDTDLAAPALALDDPGFDAQDILKHLTTVTDKFTAKKIISWALGIFFGDKLVEKYGDPYPQLFFHGVYGSGKSTMAEMTMAFFGSHESKGFTLDSSTKVGLTRVASRYSMLPNWFEESRNSIDGTAAKNSLFRSFYDRSTIVKGTKKQGEIRGTKATANCIISGEEYPNDAATISRCLLIHIDKKNHSRDKSKESFDWLMANKSLFSYIGHSILLNKKFWWDKVEKNVEGYISSLKEDSKISARNRTHNSIIAGIADTFFGDDEDFTTAVYTSAKSEEFTLTTSQSINVFWDDIYTLVSEHKIKQRYYEIFTKDDLKYIKINWAPLYGVWEQHFKNIRKEFPISKTSLLDALKHESYFMDYKQISFAGAKPFCIVLKFNKTDTPEQLLSSIIASEKDSIVSPAYELRERD